MHHPPLTTDLIVTCGSQDGLCKAIEMLLSPGDSVVVEDYIYAGTLGIMVTFFYLPNLKIERSKYFIHTASISTAVFVEIYTHYVLIICLIRTPISQITS